MPSFEEEVIARLDEMSGDLRSVRDDVTTIKARRYDDRLDDHDESLRSVSGTLASHGERIAKTEVRSGFIGAFIAGLVSFFFNGQTGA